MPTKGFCHFWLKVAFLCLSTFSFVQCTINVTPFLPQSFFFDWNKQGQPLPIPVTEQCETIHIVWSRSTAVGPNPTAPYYLQVYTSTYTLPIIIPVGDVLSYDWAVPFAPGTLYQICMFDKFGNTGGCQATYTVIPPSSMPTCSNVTFAPQLGVSALVDNGPMSQFGWVDQCTDISITPTNGTAPFTLTVAPALHPPYNITSFDAKPINWTVSLSWASPFFISLVDANGSSWANGPLHSGGGGTISCLAGNVTSSRNDTVTLPVVVGTGVGGLAVGLFFGILVAYIFLKQHFKKKMQANRFIDSAPGTPHALMFDQAPGPAQYRPVPTASSSGGISHSVLASNPSSMQRMGQVTMQYEVEPFSMPDEEGRRAANDVVSPTSYGHGPTGRVVSTHESAPHAPTTPPNQVYVVHHDSQVPPVTIYHRDGTQIVELPPRYPPYSSSQSEALSEGRSGSDSRSDGGRTEVMDPLVLHQPRQPAQAKKPPRSP
ncbi:hypothetical protein GALMADRAFT_234070 [Galerina marginata CBS 339.88]|uniref:Fibronectin type-III domain-containing protein n=1 Tax=Galerina marginata (strain CBS 339.88) TaxID=685588 RepID=A0A067TQ24_GALM3|nr:hypothetical protein GALMADRAFT_234070 [Galerina marginata CBS 339.88]